MSNNNIQLNSKDFRNAAVAWQSPQLVNSAGHEIRSFIWLGVILFILFSIGGYIMKKDREYVPPSFTRQQVSDFQQTVYSACIQNFVARGYNRYVNNNCRDIASVQTYNQFGRLP